MYIKLRLSLVFELLITLAISFSAYAGTCSITSNTLMFGKYGGTSSSPAVNGNATIFVSCTDSSSYNICVTTPDAVTARSFNNPGMAGATVYYDMYKDPARTTVLGTGDCFPLVGGVAGPVLSLTCPYSNPCQLGVYGQIHAGQVGGAGVYTGTFTAALGLTSQSIAVPVQAYITSGCNISVDQFTFGTYVSSMSDLKVAQSSIHVNCSSGLAYQVGLSAGSGSFTQRKLKSGVNTLNYNLYLPQPATPAGVCSSYSTIWRNSSPNWVTGSGTGAQQNIQLCGSIPAGQIVPTGIYTDTIVATINFSS